MIIETFFSKVQRTRASVDKCGWLCRR